MNDELIGADRLDLWKYFTDDAAKIKGRMWTIASWFYMLLAGLLAFAGKNFNTVDAALKIENAILLLVVGVIGIILSGFTWFMIYQYGKHIKSMWDRADVLRRQISELNHTWFLNELLRIQEDARIVKGKTNRLPKVAQRLIGLDILFMLLFIGILIIAMLELF